MVFGSAVKEEAVNKSINHRMSNFNGCFYEQLKEVSISSNIRNRDFSEFFL